MKKTPLVTVAVFNFNGFFDTKKCLTSLLKTKYVNFEIFVIDDGSLQNEVKKLKSIFSDKKIKYFQDGKNKGFSSRVNQVIKESKAKYIVLLNNDTVVEKYWLTELVSVAESDEKIAVCQSKLRWMNHPSYFEYAGASGGYIDRLGYPYARGRVMFSLEKDNGQYDSPAEIFWASGAAMLLKRSTAQKIGGFDTDFFAYAEEVDFCWRVKKLGYKVVVVPKSVVFHKGTGVWSKHLAKKTFLIHRNHLLLLIKHLPFVDFLWLFPIRVGMDILSIFYYINQRRWSYVAALGKAYIYILNNFSYWWKRRSKGIDPKRFPFSIVFSYYLLGKKTYNQVIGKKTKKIHLLNYEQLFLKKEKLFSLNLPESFRPKGERTDGNTAYLAPTFFQHKKAYEFCANYIKEKKVLDIGCGTGYGSFILAEKAKSVMGIDLDISTINTAKNMYKKKNLSFKHCDAKDIFYLVEKVDVVIMLQVIEHLKNPEEFLQKLSNALNKQATLIISTPNTLTQGYNENPYHIKEFNPNELKKILNNSFSSTKIYGLHGDKYVREYERKRKKNIMKIMNLDFFKLRRLLPRRVKVVLFEFFIPFARKNITKGKALSISEKSFFVTPKVDNGIDIVAVCTV